MKGSNIVAALRGRLTKRKKDATAEYWQIVEALGLGNPVLGEEELELLLTEVGKSPDDLETDSMLISQERELRTQLDERAKLKDQLRVANAGIDAIKAEFKSVVEAFEKRLKDAERNAQQVRAQVSALDRVDQDLRAIAERLEARRLPADELAQVRQRRQRRNELEHRIQQLEVATGTGGHTLGEQPMVGIEPLRAKIRELRSRLAELPEGSTSAQDQHMRRTLQAELESAERKLASVIQQRNDLTCELAELGQQEVTR